MIKIVVVNESTCVSDNDVNEAIGALQTQANRDFAPIWNTDQVSLSMIPKGQAIPAGWWELVIADNSNQVGALGYHETTSGGMPIAFVFAKDDIADGASWTVTASHELLEMLGDPFICLISEVDNADGSYSFYANEACDACEDDQFGYSVSGTTGKAILVSDFVTLAWFHPALATPPYDFRSHITKPLQILVNGYIGLLSVAQGPQWGQVTGQMSPAKRMAREKLQPFTRRHMRMIRKPDWKRSERKVA